MISKKTEMIIGIGGSSNSGKSTLANELALHFNNLKVKILCQDDFVISHDLLTRINGHIDWEQPSTIDIKKYIEAVKDANKNYDLVICEGLFAFWFSELNKLYDKKIFLKIDKNTFLNRKIKDLRWGKEPKWYIEHIWESHLKYCKVYPLKKDYYIVDASKNISIENIVKYITLEILKQTI